MPLRARVAPAADGSPAGALVLLHGRGADELDLVPLAEALDPTHRLLHATPRAPIEAYGAHWYHLHRIGQPDAATFRSSVSEAAAWLDGLLAEHRLPPDRLVIGGFSQGAVMSLALAFGAGRRRPAGVMAFSGYLPSADGFALDRSLVAGTPVVIQHGTGDTVIGVAWGRMARDTLAAAGAIVSYHEFPGHHELDLEGVRAARAWLEERMRAWSGQAG